MNISKSCLVVWLVAFTALVGACDQGGTDEQTMMAAKQSAGQTQIERGGVSITVGPLFLQLPEGWKSVPPASSMRKAQFEVEAVEGDSEPGTVSVFYFGERTGTVEMNLARWYGQFEQPDGSPTEGKVAREEFERNGMKMILVHFSGRMKASMMPGAPPAAAKDNWMNLSAIVQTPEGPWFFKGTGPAATMTHHISSMKKLLSSLRFERKE